ncbi:MAG TPA: peptidoglycan DD-metalloendopeptidase family protein [Candidatus Limnocylindrales bacterium]|nr:peptidoglycan DD-metalloendopeptidase family protein [Candidatus Limnocylindrales bacterium]
MESRGSRCLSELFALMLAAPLALGAATPSRELEGIQKKIDNEKKGLAELKVKEGSVLQSLGKIESDLDKRNRELRAANAKLLSISDELAAKKAEADDIERAIAERYAVLRQRVVALYRWQRSGSPMIILNGTKSLASFMHRKHYLQAALTYDQQLAAQLREASQRQALLQQELTQKIEQLDSQKQALGAAKEAVRQEAEKKKTLLASLRREKATRSRALREMEMAAQRLARMLDEMSRRAVGRPSETPGAPSTGSGLDAMRGRLDWPVKGRVSAPFGKFKHPEFDAEIVRKGIDIDAPLGDAIRVVERGRVVYASHFSGYGNMMIVDHGERYYTIYGHLAEMLKKNGDEVRRGEILGRVGDSDSWSGAKLYFEMRKDGRSVDPMAWLKHP